ncbi:MAG: hypothetical protein NTU98_14880 [Bacteroidetes bacterium]|nr:hypothetical protein [Bacteroidota bacterium]
MLIIIDKKIPQEARERLSESGDLLELETEGIVYPAISGHPDIFFCKTPGGLVVAPNLPEYYFNLLEKHGVKYFKGNNPSSIHHPASVHYCSSLDNRYLVHRLRYTDPVILQNSHTLNKIAVKQGYTRCNLLLLKDHHYLTSDAGIHHTLMHHGLNGLFVSPDGIILQGFQNGFIGGTMGIVKDQVFILGQLSQYAEGERVRNYLSSLDYQVIELYDGPLVDGGGILFI